MKLLIAITFLISGFQVGATQVFEGSVVESQTHLVAGTYVGLGAVYSYSAFNCDYYDQDRAMKLAADKATSDCYIAGYNQCIVLQSTIIQTGYLGYQPDFQKDLGYGCIAKAVVRGY